MNLRTKSRNIAGISLLLAGLILAACQPAGASTPTPAGNAYFQAPPSKVDAIPTLQGQAAGSTETPTESMPGVTVTGNGVEVKVSSKEGLGEFLVDGKGMTLYLYTKDSPGVSNCFEGCLAAWPPLLTDGEPSAGEGVTGQLGTITRDDGSVQVTYKGLPLYYYVSDVNPGDTTGHEVGGVWYVVAP